MPRNYNAAYAMSPPLLVGHHFRAQHAGRLAYTHTRPCARASPRVIGRELYDIYADLFLTTAYARFSRHTAAVEISRRASLMTARQPTNILPGARRALTAAESAELTYQDV